MNVEIGFELLQLLYIGCVTLITLWNCGLYSNTVKNQKFLFYAQLTTFIYAQTLKKREHMVFIKSILLLYIHINYFICNVFSLARILRYSSLVRINIYLD